MIIRQGQQMALYETCHRREDTGRFNVLQPIYITFDMRRGSNSQHYDYEFNCYFKARIKPSDWLQDFIFVERHFF